MTTTFERLYNGLIESHADDKEWKKKVDKTLKGFIKDGKTKTQAIKETVMELNTETEEVDVEGIYIKQFDGRGGSYINTVLEDGDCANIQVEEMGDYPDMPKKLVVKKIEFKRNLISDTTKYTVGADTKITYDDLPNEELFEMAKQIDEIEFGSYGLIRGEVRELKKFGDGDEYFNDRGAKIFLSFRSGEVVTNMFLRDFEDVKTLLPTKEDVDRYSELLEKEEWAEAIDFFNEVCGENFDFDYSGVTFVAYGLVKENKWTDNDGEERMGYNFRSGSGSILFSIDYLTDALSEEPPKEEEKEEEPEPESEPVKKEEPKEEKKETDKKEIPKSGAQKPIDAPDSGGDGGDLLEIVKKEINEGNSKSDKLVSAIEKEGYTSADILPLLNDGVLKMKDGHFVLA